MLKKGSDGWFWKSVEWLTEEDFLKERYGDSADCKRAGRKSLSLTLEKLVGFGELFENICRAILVSKARPGPSSLALTRS